MITGLIHGLRHLLRVVLIEPVQEGRLRDNGWAPGLRGIVIVAFSLSAVLVLTAGFSSLLRSRSELVFLPPQLSIPVIATPLIIAALFFATGTLYAALLHLRLAIRIPGLLITMLIIIRIATIDGGIDTLPAATGCLLMIIFAIVRGRASFAWGEFVMAQLLTAVTLCAALLQLRFSYGGYAPRLVLSTVDLLGSTLWLLAAPFAVLAGAAITELTISIAMAISDGLRRPDDSGRPARWSIAVVAVLVLARSAQAVQLASTTDRSGFTLDGLAGGLVTTAVPLVGWLVILGLVDRRRRYHAVGPLNGPDPQNGPEALQDWRRWAVLVATLLAGTALWLDLLLIPLRVLRLSSAVAVLSALPAPLTVNVASVVAAGALLLIAWTIRLRTGRLATILVLLACFRLIRAGFQALELSATYAGTMITADLVAVILAICWLARGTLTVDRLVGTAAVILITGLYEYRQAITEPITELLALSGALVGLLIGAIWRLITDNGFASGDSRSFPRSARVLLVLANATFGTAAIALVALQGGISDFDLQSLENLGDKQLGGDLMFSIAIVIIVHNVVTGRIRSVPPADSRV
ncbi:hypothetical protein [Microlunatus soli]|uniref:Uncharacterized protein n=1 Tax=Microlunatus soli TaxID=630515 RepID=A0A1H1WMA6_9ACTN|nr:hypothetical protein [Microlunatus soli]SDS97810.1 hypothetical protein SAMN04489812_3704 [Microlunatus soli]